MVERGRPRKEEIAETPKEKIAPKPNLKVKVVSIGDYLTKAREIYGVDDIWNNAVALLYSENEVIAVLDKKGEARFVVKA